MLIPRLLTLALALVATHTGCSGTETNVSAAARTSPDTEALTDEFRGMWVTRWDYVSPQDVKEIMANCKALGTTDVFWQVRGQADAYYESDLEPWGELLFRDTGTSPERLRKGPGYDPLEHAVREAHANGLRLHAWINAMPMWKGTEPPEDPSHPWLTRPDLRLKDLANTPQPLTDHYVIFNPVLDSTHDHLVAVLRDLNTRYDLDGIHLDYIRFVSETIDGSKVYPGDAASLSLYTAQTGRVFENTSQGLEQYRDWVKSRITRLVTRIHDDVMSSTPERALTAAVWRRPDLAQDYLQDAQRWLRLGLIDAAMPMIYTDKDEQFTGDLDAWVKAAGTESDRVIPGLGSYKHPSGVQTVRQLNASPSPDRYILFAYSTYFESRAPDQDRSPEAKRLRAAHRLPLTRHANP